MIGSGRTAIVAGVALGAGIVFGTVITGRGAADAVAARPSVRAPAADDGTPAVACGTAGPSVAALLGTVREVVREEERALRADLSQEIATLRDEVRALRTEHGPDGTETVMDPAAAARGREAFDRALASVRERIQVGSWRVEDRERLHGLLALLDGAQQQEVLTTVLPAINEGRMTVANEIIGPPF